MAQGTGDMTGAVDEIVGNASPAVKRLEEQVAKLEEALAKARASRHKIPTQKARFSKRGSFIRVFLPDTHGNLVDPSALSAFMADLSLLQPREIYCMGDHLDCGGWLAAHHTLGLSLIHI